MTQLGLRTRETAVRTPRDLKARPSAVTAATCSAAAQGVPGELGFIRCLDSASEDLESPIPPSVDVGGRKARAPTYREWMRFSAFREWVSQRSVRASSSALSCSQVSLLGAPIKPTDTGKKDVAAVILGRPGRA